MDRPTEPKKKNTFYEFTITYYVVGDLQRFRVSFLVIMVCFVFPNLLEFVFPNLLEFFLIIFGLFVFIGLIFGIGNFFDSLSKRNRILKVNKPPLIVKIEKEKYEIDYAKYLKLLNEYDEKKAVESKEREEILKLRREVQRLKEIEYQKQLAEKNRIENDKKNEELKKQEELRLIKEKQEEEDRLNRIKEEAKRKEEHIKVVIETWNNRLNNFNLKIREDWPQMVLFMDERGIDKLYHFTDISNIESIVQHSGLFSWRSAEDLGINIPKPAGIGIGRQLDVIKGLAYYVRLSYNKNNPMRYVALKEKRIDRTVFLEVDPIVMLLENTLFTEANATKNDVFAFNQLDKLMDLFIYKKMLYDEDGNVNEIEFQELNANNVLSSAEILVHKHVPLEFILNIQKFIK